MLAILDPATFEKFQSGQDTTITFQLHWGTLQGEVNVFLNKESKSIANCSGSSYECFLDILKNGIKFEVILDKKPYALEIALEKNITKMRASAEGFEMNIEVFSDHVVLKIIANDKQVEIRVPGTMNHKPPIPVGPPTARPSAKHSLFKRSSSSGPPAYDPPAYDPPAYGPPAYGPPAYGPPAYGPAAYCPPAYDPSAGNNFPRPTFENLFNKPIDDNILDRFNKIPFLHDGVTIGHVQCFAD